MKYSKKSILLKISLTLSTFLYTTPNVETRLDERLFSKEELLNLIKQAQHEETNNQITPEDLQELRSINPKKEWTVIVYMAADNDLHPFAWKNLKQMEQIGSTEHINIVVQLHTPGHSTPTKRYIIKKGRRILALDPTSPNTKLNSGHPQTLIDCVAWATQHYPANHYGLIFWNHGSAAIDPNFSKTVNPCDLFYCDPVDNMLTVDRGISYLTLLAQMNQSAQQADKRGICFDDTFKSYISNADLDMALRTIQQTVLHGQNFDLIIFDACLMSMIEIASIVRKYANFMATSQEVVYGTGQNYEYLFRPFLTEALQPKNFARHAVIAYEQTYQKIINDYTFSALDLKMCSNLESNIDIVARLLQEALIHQTGYSVSNMLRKCKSTQFCTCFDEPSYIDLSDFCTNILGHIAHINLKNKQHEQQLQATLKQALQQCIDSIQRLVIENRIGQKLNRAKGISIYFPEHVIAPNYFKSPFALNSFWSQLLTKYLSI